MIQLKKKLQEKKVEVLFTDYYDTLVHRRVHPNQVLRICSKILIKELGLIASIDDLYFTLKDAVNHLVEKLKIDRNELAYKKLIDEVFTRLNNANIVDDSQKHVFATLFEKAQLKAEQSVQYLNKNTVQIIQDFKNEGGKVYLVSDFYGPSSLFNALLKHHNIDHLFDAIYISSDVGKSKHKGSIYQFILSDLAVEPHKVLMIGDNLRSDSIHAEKAGLHSFLMPHKNHLRKNKMNSFGSDGNQLRNCVSDIYDYCNQKDNLPYTEYVIYYHFFVERLYKICKVQGIDSLFFLSREGLFLKRLFDSYQTFHQIDSDKNIRTHYIKVSRQAALQISLKSIDDEEFSYLRKKYDSMSLNEFFKFLNLKETDKKSIYDTLDVEYDTLELDLFESKQFKKLKKNAHFLKIYEAHCKSNRAVFKEYIQSFGEDIEGDGINVVDIGWGGTMQEAIYKFFDEKVKVTGFYLGINTIYSPNNNTKRHGLNFSILPYVDYDSNILRANAQQYEQFASASHGTCIEYSKVDGGYTVEFHDENEKYLYDNYLKEHQDKMFEVHQKLLKNLEMICYSQEMVSTELNNVALKSGILQNIRKIKFLKILNAGYYQNLSNKKTGIDYEIPKNLLNPKEFIKFLMKPEEYFRYIVKLKQKLYNSNRVLYYIFPGYLVLGYYRLNRFLRFRALRNVSLLKYNYFR
ncbi:HAD family hydrolase [Gelidibacter salicanalis]|uniref:HAD family hydrolase n=1 Tax=Gelidibacter salicanalis TaxID=291193 RepID=A0A934NK55_9FLAO|nr:HAD family hydrolase [Gelidibacter salicanalis]MBJ7882704.1 HAD family hydrolase [Gelidibacter salicanalis]